MRFILFSVRVSFFLVSKWDWMNTNSSGISSLPVSLSLAKFKVIIFGQGPNSVFFQFGVPLPPPEFDCVTHQNI